MTVLLLPLLAIPLCGLLVFGLIRRVHLRRQALLTAAPPHEVSEPLCQCSRCGVLATGSSHGPHPLSSRSQTRHMITRQQVRDWQPQAQIEELARTNPAAWLRARLMPDLPDISCADTTAYIKLALKADLFLDKLGADQAERQLLLPAAAAPLDLRLLRASRGPWRMVGRMGLRVQAGEVRLRLAWLMPGDPDPYLVTL